MRELIFEKLYRGQDYSGIKIPRNKSIINFFEKGEIVVSESLEINLSKGHKNYGDKLPF